MIAGLSPMDELDEVVRAVKVPVQAVGGLSIGQAIECPAHGAPLVVLGAPLVIDADEFKTAGTDLHDVLSEICREIRKHAVQRQRTVPPPTSDAECTNCSSRVVARKGSFTIHHHDIQSAVVQYALEPLAVELREVPVPEIGDDDVLLRGRRGVGLRLRRAPGVQHALLAGERPGHARARVRRHVAQVGRAVRGFREGDRVVSETAAVICGACAHVPERALQPVPDAEGVRLRRRRRDGRVRAGAGALPAPCAGQRCRSIWRA